MDSYRSLEAWKRAHAALLLTLPALDQAYHPRSKSLFDQIRRAVISIEANIVEGYALNTRPLFRRHLRIAMGSAAEAECLLRVAAELGYLTGAVVTSIEGKLAGAMAATRGLLRSTPVTGAV